MGQPKNNVYNWARNYHCSPEQFLQPASQTELAELVRKAARQGKRIRVVGAGHSWSPNFLTNDWLVNLDHLDKLISLDKTTGLVRIEGGMRLKALNQLLADNGLAMNNLGSISEQSVAGAISTGTHGSGIKYPNLSCAVAGLKLLLANGESIEINENENAEWLPAARVSFGALGIITEITLQCVPTFNLREYSFPQNFDDATASFCHLHREVDHYKFWWMPHTGVMQASYYSRTHRAARPYSRMQSFVYGSVLQDKLFLGLLGLGQIFPSWRPAINSIGVSAGFKPRKRVDRSDRVFNIPMPVRHLEYEYAIPAEDAPEALKRMKALMEDPKIWVNFVVEIRFVKGDDSWLSPAYGRDSCYIGCFMRGEKFWREYSSGFEAICADYDGRPHWGKDFTLTAKQLRPLYPRFDDFLALRNQLDPNRLWANDWLKRVLGE